MSLLPTGHGLLARRIDRLERRIAALEAQAHAGHGRGNAEDGPDGSDCPCRTTDEALTCARVGCGFCLAEVTKETP